MRCLYIPEINPLSVDSFASIFFHSEGCLFVLFIVCCAKAFVSLGPIWFFCLFVFNKFIYLFLAVLGLCCCAWAFSSCGERGLLFIVVRGLLIAVASLVVEHGL